MVRNDRRVHLPSCQIIHMTIGNLLTMPVSDQGGAVVADDDFDNGSSSYDDEDDDDDNKE